MFYYHYESSRFQLPHPPNKIGSATKILFFKLKKLLKLYLITAKEISLVGIDYYLLSLRKLQLSFVRSKSRHMHQKFRFLQINDCLSNLRWQNYVWLQEMKFSFVRNEKYSLWFTVIKRGDISTTTHKEMCVLHGKGNFWQRNFSFPATKLLFAKSMFPNYVWLKKSENSSQRENVFKIIDNLKLLTI